MSWQGPISTILSRGLVGRNCEHTRYSLGGDFHIVHITKTLWQDRQRQGQHGSPLARPYSGNPFRDTNDSSCLTSKVPQIALKWTVCCLPWPQGKVSSRRTADHCDNLPWLEVWDWYSSGRDAGLGSVWFSQHLWTGKWESQDHGQCGFCWHGFESQRPYPGEKRPNSLEQDTESWASYGEQDRFL